MDANFRGLDSREDLRRAMQRVVALKEQGKVLAAAADLIGDVVGLNVEARSTVLTGTDDEIAELGRDLLRLRQLQDMLDGKGKESRTSQSLLRSPNRPGSRRLASPGGPNVTASGTASSADAASVAANGKGEPASPEVPIVIVGAGAPQPSSSAPLVVGSAIQALTATTYTTQVTDEKGMSSALRHDAPSSTTAQAPTPSSGPSENGLQGDNAGGATHLSAAKPSSSAAPVVPARGGSAIRQGAAVLQNARHFSPFNRTLLGVQPSAISSNKRKEGGKDGSRPPPPPTTATAAAKGRVSPPPPPSSQAPTMDPLQVELAQCSPVPAAPPISTTPASSGSPDSRTPSPGLLVPSPSGFSWSFLCPPPPSSVTGGGKASPVRSLQSNPSTPAKQNPPATEDQNSALQGDMTWLAKRAATSAAHFRPLNQIVSPGRKSTKARQPEVKPRDSDKTRPASSPPTAARRADKKPEIRGILKHKRNSTGAKTKKVTSFGNISMRFFSYTIGETVPSDKGPCLGLGWGHEAHGSLECTIDAFEKFRGVVWGADELNENEEWDPNWRTPSKFFTEDCHVPIERRVELLLSSGHRRPSIDLNRYEVQALSAARQASGRSRAGLMVLRGGDPDKAMEVDARVQAMRFVMTWLSKLVRQRRRIREAAGGRKSVLDQGQAGMEVRGH